MKKSLKNKRENPKPPRSHEITKKEIKSIFMVKLRFFVASCLRGGACFILFFLSTFASAQESWVFLPVTPLFQPLKGDPREPQTSVIAHTSQTRYEGSLGTTFELLRYNARDQSQWGWGLCGGGFILLDQEGAAFPMRDNDWVAGMYLSESSGAFAHRLEFVHQSSHLGDSLEGIREPIIYNGENFNFTTSFNPSRDWRLYAGTGVWENFFPNDNAFFASLGTEVYSPAVDFIGSSLKAYGTFHLKWKALAGGTWNKTAQLGIRLQFSSEDTRAVRLALVFYDGKAEYGQFYQDQDNHWALGVYFDP